MTFWNFNSLVSKMTKIETGCKTGSCQWKWRKFREKKILAPGDFKLKKWDFSLFLVICEKILPYSDRKYSKIFLWTLPNTKTLFQRTTMPSFINFDINLGWRDFLSNLKSAIFDIFIINSEIILPFWTGNRRGYFSAYCQFE